MAHFRSAWIWTQPMVSNWMTWVVEFAVGPSSNSAHFVHESTIIKMWILYLISSLSEVSLMRGPSIVMQCRLIPCWKVLCCEEVEPLAKAQSLVMICDIGIHCKLWCALNWDWRLSNWRPGWWSLLSSWLSGVTGWNGTNQWVPLDDPALKMWRYSNFTTDYVDLFATKFCSNAILVSCISKNLL